MDAAEPGGVVAGRYKLQAVLGRGGMGVVWLASDELLRREVAVKEIFWPAQLDEEERETLRQRALREARAAARLDHPNVIRVHDVVEEDGRPWIVMQLARYRSLRDVVRDDGPLPPGRVAQVGLQVLAAIEAAHDSGVLHRDVKPDNVLLSPDDRVILTDFGLAVADGNTTLTTAGLLIGSPSYMAPERARGGRATPAADLWSLGATLYAAVEGRPPFDREGAMAVLTAVVSADPDPPKHAGPLWPIIAGLLRKDPAKRLDAAETERMLRRVAAAVAPAPADKSTAPLPGTVPAVAGQAAGDGWHGAPDPRTQPQRQAAAASSFHSVPPMIPGLAPGREAPSREPPAPQESPARYQPAAGPPPSPPGPTDTVPSAGLARRPRLRWLAAGVLAAAAAATVAIALVSHHGATGGVASPGSHRAQPPAAATGHPHGTPAAHHSPAGHARSGAAAHPHGPRTAGLPSGFSWYHDPTGFSIGRPKGWQVSHRGHLVYIQDPASGRFLIIDQTTHPQPNPLADWRQQEAARMSTFPGYHRIRLAAVRYPQAEKAADWEFTFYQNGQLTHVLNRNILVNSQHAYALYWSTPANQWAASYHLFQAFAATFRPLGGPPGS